MRETTLKLNPIFNSNMVFAAGKPIRIFGEGKGKVEINFASFNKRIKSSSDKWIVEFPAMEYGGPYQMTVVFESETVLLKDIYIGEVYLFAGQSNMQFKLHESSTPRYLYETNGNLRLFSTDKLDAGDYFTSTDGWIKSEKEQVGKWSAIAYLAGNEISKTKGVAVGVIACYQGASVIESWVPTGTFERANIQIPIGKRHSDHTCELFSDWNEDGKLYAYALSQVIPYSISAVVWYQGESDTTMEEGEVYALELIELIKVWRSDFGDELLPFVIIQIADYVHREDEAWRSVQKAQIEVKTMALNIETIISADVCENDDIHPKTKDKLAKRVAKVLIHHIKK